MFARKRFPQPGRYFLSIPTGCTPTLFSSVPCFLPAFPQMPRVTPLVCTWRLLSLGSLVSAWAGGSTQKCGRCSASGIKIKLSHYATHSSSQSCSFPLDRIWNNFPHLLLTQWVWDFVGFTMILWFLPNLFQEVKKISVHSVTGCF